MFSAINHMHYMGRCMFVNERERGTREGGGWRGREEAKQRYREKECEKEIETQREGEGGQTER